MAQDILTALGFKRKRYADYIVDLQNKARELFGEDVNLEDQSPMGRWVQLIAYQHAEANELAEKVWLSVHVETAEGVSLDYAVKKYGIRREQSQPATGNIEVTTIPGKTIGVGELTVETEDGIRFTNTASGTAVTNTLVLPVRALESGPEGNVPAHTITAIFTPIADVEAVTNPAPTSGGKNKETDDRLRERYYATMGRGGSSTTDGVRVAMLEVPGVRAAVVIENNLSTPDGEGRPPHCIAPVVLGGDPQAVAEAIHSKKAGGISSYGSTVKTVRDKSGYDQAIGFSYATKAPIYVNVNLTKNNLFPANGVEKVKDEIIQYIGGDNAQNETYLGLGMAVTVKHAQVIGAILRTIPGIDDLTVTLRKGDSGEFAAANIPIGKTEVAETDAGKVVVTVA